MSRWIPLGILVLAVASGSTHFAQSDRAATLAEYANNYLKRWLDEDARYIISDEERDVFNALTTDEEREQFQEQFWLRRDPTPDTLENEYKDEHYRRIAYANDHFASGFPGWKTDRGGIYIIHGEPASKESMPMGGTYYRPFNEGGGVTTVYPFEQWRYRYIEGLGQEIVFEFVDPSGTGEYRLALTPHEKDALANVPGTGHTLFESMQEDPDAAKLLRGTAMETNMVGGQPNQFDRLRIFSAAFKAPDVEFKDLETIVTTNLSFNLLPFDVRMDFVRITNSTINVPITLQVRNRDLSFLQESEFHSATLHIYGRVTGINGRVAQVFEDTVTVGPYPDEIFERYLDQAQVYQKTVPLAPGRYKLDLVVKDLNSENVGTFTQATTVPRFPEGELASSSLIIADLIEPEASRDIGTAMFTMGDIKVRPSVTEQFRQGDDLNYWLQVYNLTVDEATRKPAATIETLILRDGVQVEKISENTAELSNAAQQLTLQRTFMLTDYVPGRYTLQVRVIDDFSGNVTVQTGEFVVIESTAVAEN
jgi:GWxTD domain-containing protein